MTDQQSEQPQGRTDLAYARTVLAVERTYNSWVKTSIGFLAGGLALTKLMEAELTTLHGAIILAGSTLLGIVAIVITAVATLRYRDRMSDLGEQALGRWPFRVVLFISGSFILICIIGLVCLFML
ncbi:MAG: DUF202 domain-containing protein [Wenzhouxiangellaceae bacterium]|nr:DUF202 domain-containing protein [Wenzhouxiangellaceae bacterium]